MTLLHEIKREALANLRPPPATRLSEWMEREFYLPDTNAQPGKIRLYGYQRAIADAISDPAIERVSIIKAARVGFTTLLTGAIGSYVANEPAPILCLLPTEADCRDYVVSDIEPAFETSPALRGALRDGVAGGEDRNVLLSRRFAGGSLKIVAAKSPRNLRRHTARVLFADEVDGMEIGKEGNPLTLAERRTLSFDNRKIIVGSTPTDEQTSLIMRAYARSDQRIFECACPSCGVMQELVWECIEWPEDRPEDAFYRCPHCQTAITEDHKSAMVANGEWRATKPEVRGHAGFRLSALVSPLANAAWGKLAAEYVVAKNDPAELQVFTNTLLGLPFGEAGSELDEDKLAATAQPFDIDHIPEEVLVLTAGCDVQDDRIEVTICGWTRARECYVLSHQVFFGSPDQDDVWQELDELLRNEWQHPFGGKLKIDCMCVDSGDMPDRVYKFCHPRTSRRVYAVKGAAGQRPDIAVGGKVRNGRVWIVGTDSVKSQVYSRAERRQGIRFSNTLPQVFYEQLCGERRVTYYRRGRSVRVFERIKGRRNEALDCVVYSFAARAALQIPLDQRADDLRSPQLVRPRPTVFKSNFMQR